MSMTKACCSNPAIELEYEARGKEIQLGDLAVYETGDLTSKRLLISVSDIFGCSPQAKQVADKIGGTGFRVVLPGFFREGGWHSPEMKYPRADKTDIGKWLGKVGQWETIKLDILAVIEHYKKGGMTSYGIVGFCWGAKMAIQSGSEIPDIKGVGIVHPTFVNQDDFEKLQSPILIAPSKDDIDMIPFYNRAIERLGDKAVEHVRFEDMQHGFAGARGPLSSGTLKGVAPPTARLRNYVSAAGGPYFVFKIVNQLWRQILTQHGIGLPCSPSNPHAVTVHGMRISNRGNTN